MSCMILVTLGVIWICSSDVGAALTTHVVDDVAYVMAPSTSDGGAAAAVDYSTASEATYADLYAQEPVNTNTNTYAVVSATDDTVEYAAAVLAEGRASGGLYRMKKATPISSTGTTDCGQ